MNKTNSNDLLHALFNSEDSRNTLKNILETIFDAEVKIKVKDNNKENKLENSFEEAYNKVYYNGYEDGEINGYIQKEEETIKNMLNMNLDIDFIAKSLNVDKKQIEMLK